MIYFVIGLITGFTLRMVIELVILAKTQNRIKRFNYEVAKCVAAMQKHIDNTRWQMHKDQDLLNEVKH